MGENCTDDFNYACCRFDRPNDLVTELGLEEGDELYVLRTPDGVELTRLDPDFEEALEISRKAIRKYPNAVKKLAEG